MVFVHRFPRSCSTELVSHACKRLVLTHANFFPLFPADKLYAGTDRPASGLVVTALASGLSLFAAMAASINISGGHVNPAITFGALVGGRISLVRAIYYWVAQFLGAIIATLLLRLVTTGMVINTVFLPRVLVFAVFVDSVSLSIWTFEDQLVQVLTCSII